MIEFENVSFSYTGQEHGGLHDINLKISDGECVLFCGRSGCGKTTITRLVNGLIPQFYQGELHGRVLVDGQEISNIPMYQIAAKVGSVFQNPRTQFFNVDTDSEIAFGIENEARPPQELIERVEQTADDLRIQKLRNRNIFELSGGEKQKIAFASVYAMNPQIYLLDEPSSNLDMTSIQELREHLRLMLPLFCAKLANSIFVDLTSYKNLMISKNKILGVMNEPEETGSMEPLQIATHEITFDSVDFSYLPGEPVLKHATFTVPDQKLTAIVGDSGSGKSTILNLIAKYYEATGGTISIGGKPINHVAAERVLEQISMVDQDVFLFDDTIRENIRHARPEATDEEIEAACREANCDGFIRKMEKGYDTPTGENGNLLSGGERQRISIARAILKNSPILLLDEATASLDIENELAVKRAIANLLKEKKTVVMIAHTLSIVKNADQILVVSGGKIAEAGTHDELLAKGGKYAAMWNAEQKLSA